MKVSLDEFSKEFDEQIDRLAGGLVVVFEETAMAAKALIENRITETGIDSHGGQIKLAKGKTEHYSDAYLSFKKGEGNNPYLTEPKHLASNRYKGFVDYTLTGALWNNIAIVRTAVTNGEIRVSVGAQSPDNQDKLAHLTAIYEDVFLMTENEQGEIVPEIFDEQLQELVDLIFK